MSGTLRLITADTAVGFGALTPEFGLFNVTGAGGSPYVALSDSDDTSYISWVSGPTTSVMRFEMSDPVDMPAGARPYGLQASVRIARTDVLPAGTLPAVYYRIHNGEYVGGPSGVPDFTNTNSAVAPLTTPTTFHGVIENKVSSGEQMDQATLNRLTLEVFGLNATVLRLYEAYIDAYYDEMPVATVTGPTGQIQATASPTVTWTYTDDLQPQVAYQVEIYHGTGTTSAAYLSGERTGAATSFQIPVVLANGNYTVRVRVAQKWPYAGSAFWGNWSTGTFSIAAAAFSTPAIHVNEFHGFNEIEAQHNANLLSFNEAAGQDNSSEWSSLITGARAIFFSDTVYHTGPFGFRMTSHGAGTETTRRDIPYVIAKRGQAYRFQGFFNLESTSTPCNVLLGLEFFDQNMNPVTTGYLGSAVTEEHGRWVTPKVDGEAPDDGFVRPYIRWDGAVDNDYHYFDDMALWMTGDDFPEPQFGRGHLLYDQAQTSAAFAASAWPVVGPNLFPDVDAGTDGLGSTWATGSDNTATGVTANYPLIGAGGNPAGFVGRNVLLMKGTSGAGTLQARRNAAQRFRVDAGEHYVMYGKVHCASAVTAHASVARMVMRFYDSNGTYFTSASASSTPALTGAVWSDCTVWAGSALTSIGTGTDPAGSKYVIVPSGAAFMEVALELVAPTVAGDEYYWDRLACYKLDSRSQPTGWREGPPRQATGLGEVVFEYQETAGIDRDWHELARVEIDPLHPTVKCQDWDIASGVQRNYRAKTSRLFDGQVITSADSPIVSKTQTFTGTWVSLVGGPGIQYVFDGDPAKQEVIDSQLLLTPIVGRDFPITEANNNRIRSVQCNLALTTQHDIDVWRYMARQLVPVVLRDGRGRRMRGVPQSVTMTDEKFGMTVQFTLMVAGDQSIKEQP